MLMGKKLSILTFVGYTVIAHIFGTIIEIHWIHILSLLILINILYHLLEWKYDWVEESEEEND